jgi:putative ABC transport system permease protein
VIVASVNIMNTMYASILERTKEIGVFKAIGARNSEIVLIFMAESGVLSLIGGIIGLIIGFLIAKVGGLAISAAGYGFLKPFFSWQMVFWILFFSLLVGLAAGLLPAYKASKLKPVETLRYE